MRSRRRGAGTCREETAYRRGPATAAAGTIRIPTTICQTNELRTRAVTMFPRSPQADAVGRVEHDPAEVERHNPFLRRDPCSAPLEHVDELLVRPTEGRLPDALERRLLEGAVDQDVGALAKPRGRDPRERL